MRPIYSLQFCVFNACHNMHQLLAQPQMDKIIIIFEASEIHWFYAIITIKCGLIFIQDTIKYSVLYLITHNKNFLNYLLMKADESIMDMFSDKLWFFWVSSAQAHCVHLFLLLRQRSDRILRQIYTENLLIPWGSHTLLHIKLTNNNSAHSY